MPRRIGRAALIDQEDEAGGPPAVHGTATPGAIAVSVSLPAPTITAVQMLLPDTRGFWDFRGSNASTPVPNTAPGFSNGSMHFSAYTTSTINGVTCVASNSGTSGVRIYTGGLDSPMNGIARPCWIMLAQQQVGDTVLADLGPNIAGRPHCYNLSASGQWTMNNGTAVNVGARDLNPNVLCFVFNGASSKFYKNGALVSTVDAGTSTQAGSTEMALHNVSGGGVGPGAGQKMGMVMTGSGVPSDADVIAVQNAWKAVWGIA